MSPDEIDSRGSMISSPPPIEHSFEHEETETFRLLQCKSSAASEFPDARRHLHHDRTVVLQSCAIIGSTWSGVLASTQGVRLLRRSCEIGLGVGCKLEKPDPFAPVRRTPGDSFLKWITFTGQFALFQGRISPMSIEKPPSPDIEMNLRPG